MDSKFEINIVFVLNFACRPLKIYYILEADFLQFDEFDMSPECPGSEVDPYIDPDEIITSEDRERILEMGRLVLLQRSLIQYFFFFQ